MIFQDPDHSLIRTPCKIGRQIARTLMVQETHKKSKWQQANSEIFEISWDHQC